MKKLLRGLQEFLDRFTAPTKEELILALTINTASLELAKGEYIELARCRPGQCGPFKLSGNSLPVFEYVMFEKKIMEFINVRVEVSKKPYRIQYICTIASNTAPELHGKEVEAKERYKEPFEYLIRHLFRYFPYARPRMDHDKKRWDQAKRREILTV